MFVCKRGHILAFFLLFWAPVITQAQAWDSDDFEIFDLVEEVNKNFYEVLGLDSSASSADIRRAYRRLSVKLHPDKNKEENAEEKFRQLVAVADVLKDEDKRQRYDLVVEHGLPDWRQPVFYYRRARKMGLLELFILLTLVLTVGHYLVVWSMYWERRFELESIFESKKKREKKSKKSNKQQADNQPPPDPLAMLDDQNVLAKPLLSDIIPCQMFRLVTGMILGIPSAIRWFGEQIEHWKESRRKVEEVESEEEEEEEEEDTGDEKERTKRRQRIDPAMYEYDRTGTAPVTSTVVNSNNVCDTNSAISNGKPKVKQLGDEWTHEDTRKLVKAMTRYPGGASQRWEKIADEVGWPLKMVTKKAKSLKTSGFATHVDAATQGITGGVQHEVTSKSGKALGAAEDTSDNLPYNSQSALNSYDDDDGANVLVWTQRQQKVFEKAISLFPKGTDARWDKISDAVPGKSKEECLIRFKELVEAIRRKKQICQ